MLVSKTRLQIKVIAVTVIVIVAAVVIIVGVIVVNLQNESL